MKIKEIRTRVVQWKGDTVSLPPHFCTNPMDVLAPMLSDSRTAAPSKAASARGKKGSASMGTFTFHGWLICEIFADNGLVGIGEAALAPLASKQVIDLYLEP